MREMAESSQRKRLPGSDTESQRIYAEIFIAEWFCPVSDQAARVLRPFARLLLIVFRPDLVLIFRRNPCLFFLFLRWG